MVQIVLIRPGATDFEVQRRIRGTLDVPLNEQGLAQVARLCDELQNLKLDIVYCSPCQPAVQTAEAIGKALDLKVKKLEQLQNLNYGLWQGMLIEEVRLKQPKVYRQWQEMPHTVSPPEGEMLSEAEARVRAAMAKLLKWHKTGTIGLVVPEPLARLVRRFFTQCELGDLWKAETEQATWECLEVQPELLAAAT